MAPRSQSSTAGAPAARARSWNASSRAIISVSRVAWKRTIARPSRPRGAAPPPIRRVAAAGRGPAADQEGGGLGDAVDAGAERAEAFGDLDQGGGLAGAGPAGQDDAADRGVVGWHARVLSHGWDDVVWSLLRRPQITS